MRMRRENADKSILYRCSGSKGCTASLTVKDDGTCTRSSAHRADCTAKVYSNLDEMNAYQHGVSLKKKVKDPTIIDKSLMRIIDEEVICLLYSAIILAPFRIPASSER